MQTCKPDRAWFIATRLQREKKMLAGADFTLGSAIFRQCLEQCKLWPHGGKLQQCCLYSVNWRCKGSLFRIRLVGFNVSVVSSSLWKECLCCACLVLFVFSLGFVCLFVLFCFVFVACWSCSQGIPSFAEIA